MLFGESIERDWCNVAMRVDAKIVGKLGDIQSRCNLQNLYRLFISRLYHLLQIVNYKNKKSDP